MGDKILELLKDIDCDKCPLRKICNINVAVYNKGICEELREKED